VKCSLAAVLIGGTAVAADEHMTTVKGIYLDREHQPNVNGMRFDILLEQPDGAKVEVPVTYEFRTGDRFWLRMDVRRPVYVYVLNRTLTGDKGIAVVREEDMQRRPPEAEAPHLVFGPERLSRGVNKMAPKTAAMRFDQTPGIEKLYVIVSPKRLKVEQFFGPDGRMIIDDAHRDSLPNLDQNLNEWSGNADMAVPDKDGAKGVYQDNNGYCVSRKPDQALMFEITLRHNQ
jgi:hypothetical protein